jgi:hypothetical protein
MPVEHIDDDLFRLIGGRATLATSKLLMIDRYEMSG